MPWRLVDARSEVAVACPGEAAGVVISGARSLCGDMSLWGEGRSSLGICGCNDSHSAGIGPR